MNVIDKMARGLEAVRGRSKTPSDSSALHELHEQFHAVQHVMCHVPAPVASTPAYAQAVTVTKELRVVLHRLWDYRGDPPRRDLPLDLFKARLQELRAVLRRTVALRQRR